VGGEDSLAAVADRQLDVKPEHIVSVVVLDESVFVEALSPSVRASAISAGPQRATRLVRCLE
jgi:hypothetical protein